jgi:TetR/AcrR family transcriptional regulator, acrAB operon repressor
MARRTKEEAQETRQRIIDAAETVFHRQGVSRTSLTHIAEEAGVTRGAIYWHFKDKADLFDAMIQRVIGPTEAGCLSPALLEADDPLAAMRALALDFLLQVARDPQHQRVFDIAIHKSEYVGEMAAARDRHLDCARRHRVMLEAAMRLAQERGLIDARANPHWAAEGLIGLIDGLLVNWTLDNRLFPLAEYAEPIIDTYLAGLRRG